MHVRSLTPDTCAARLRWTQQVVLLCRPESSPCAVGPDVYYLANGKAQKSKFVNPRRRAALAGWARMSYFFCGPHQMVTEQVAELEDGSPFSYPRIIVLADVLRPVSRARAPRQS